MPAYNEEDNIGEAIERVDQAIRQTGLSYELIVVDDGSIDGTRIKVEDYTRSNDHVRIIGYERNMGKGYAIKMGFTHAKGDTIIFLDSDLDINPRQITRYIKALEQGDIVIASKWHPQSRVKIPLIRRILSHGFNVLVKLLTGIRLRDTQTGLKAVRRKTLENVFSRLTVKRFAFDVELLAIANLYGLKIIELPVDIHMKHGSFSFREVWRILIDLLGITYRLRILKWYQRLEEG